MRKIIKDAGKKEKKSNARNQMGAEEYHKIKTTGSQHICHNNNITDIAAVLDNPSTTTQ